MRRFERRHVGAIPVGGTILNRPAARVNEQRSPKAKVAGENPAGPTNLLRDRLISRTTDFESVYHGASPFPAAKRRQSKKAMLLLGKQRRSVHVRLVAPLLPAWCNADTRSLNLRRVQL